MGNNTLSLVGLLVGTGLSAPVALGAVIYQDDFSGPAVPLNGMAPDVRPGTQTWISSNLRADGTVSSPSNSSWLPYTLENDREYTLSLTSDFTYAVGSNTPLLLSFSSSVSQGAANMASPANGAMLVLAVMRGGSYSFSLGQGTGSPAATGSGLFNTHQDDLEMRLVLTTSSTSDWTVAGYIGGNQVDLNTSAPGLLYTVPTGQVTTSSIVGVRFGYNSSVAIAENFSFSVVPEPSVLGAALGGLVLLGRRRALR